MISLTVNASVAHAYAALLRLLTVLEDTQRSDLPYGLKFDRKMLYRKLGAQAPCKVQGLQTLVSWTDSGQLRW
jgi:hypothetical protein